VPLSLQPTYLADSFSKLLAVIDILEHNRKYLNTNPRCEPFLGKRNLYRPIGGFQDVATQQLALLWVLNLSDGEHDFLDTSVIVSALALARSAEVTEITVRPMRKS
jgi:aminopeptidase-like protein